ncbi:methyltransferase family protein [Anaerobacterium chartisolvens]|uniref:Methyltransferase family protein n=1 Tax=Anaerobacterium chartisolvens TaxID=1297424 RepID=A0A369BKM1_9FIRM|nr:class I SAM-dependent methyltransferase [Anaerobacterium chartisolvens]RCX21017.1 methyltransferase family protein [Anaerobacterium chartisolvens]
MNYKKTVIDYFRDKAKEYDLVDNQVYWKLSDKLLWEFFSTNVLQKLPENFSFIDAGGGTGRWSIKILEEFPYSTGLIYDLSEDMLEQAREKIRKYGLGDRLNTMQGDIKDICAADSNSFNLAFNFHNVLGFVDSPTEVIKELARVVKPNGYVVSLVPNWYHNIFFNIFVNNFRLVDEAVSSGRGRFTEDMPSMNLFTPDSIKKVYKDCGLEIITVSGFPVTIYPGMQETQLRGSSNHIINILDNEEMFNKIFDLEKAMFTNSDLAARGNQIFIMGIKY